MDIAKDLQQIFIASVHKVLEEKVASKFDIRKSKNLDLISSISDIFFSFDLTKQNIVQKVYYFIDRKMMLNLIKSFIQEIDNLDFNNDFILSIINELNNLLISTKMLNNLIIKKKPSEKSENEYIISNIEIIKGHNIPIFDTKTNTNITFLSSVKGDFIIGFPNEEVKKDSISKNKKNINISNEVKQVSNSVLSAVQMLEIKKYVLMTLTEIKDLKGDSEFLLRKSKSLSELMKIWFDVLKEESKS